MRSRFAPTVEVCRRKKRVPKPLLYLAKARAVALEVECHGLCVLGRLGHKVHMSANLNERNVGGYSVAYRRDDTHFPVYVTAAMAAMFFTAAWITGATYWLALAVPAARLTYYHHSLLEAWPSC